MYNDEHNLYHYTYRKDGSEAEAHSAPQPGPVQDHNSGPQQPVQEMKPVKKNRIGLKVTALALCCALLGGAVGGGIVWGVGRSGDETSVNVSGRTVSQVALKTVDGKTAMSDAEVYAANVNSVVSINVTGTNSNNFFGQPVQTASSGSGFILPMLAKLKEFGIEPRLRFIVDEIIVNDKKEVIGVKARQGYRFGRENSGKVLYVRATKGVLIAAGGFAQNVKYRMSQDPRLTDKFTSTNHPGATGEMIMQAQEIGANTVQMDWIQLGPWTSPDEKGFGVAPLFVESCVGLGPMVDPATGKRFIKETGNRKVRADAIVAIGHPCVIYTCEANVMNAIVGHNMTDKLWEHALKTGVVKKFDTLKDLAAGYGIDYATLEKTNETFNGYMKAMKDPEFDCMFFKGASVNDKGPFYGVRLWPRVHHCMGGLEINEHAQVMSVRGTPIKGLYAAGEATGGVHGMVRLGTVAVADCMIFGRIAARDAFKKA